jgi:hypothetical protein
MDGMSLFIWQGFDHYWQREPHRLNHFGSFIEQDGVDSHAEFVYRSAMQIGRFPPDVCHAHSTVQWVDGADVQRIDGSVTATLEGWVGGRASFDGEPITLTLPDNQSEATVIMRGFELESIFSHGFHTRGFGFSLSEMAQQGKTFSFRPGCFVFPDRSPDPFTDRDRIYWRILPFPDSLEPQSPGEFAYTATLHYSVLTAEPGKACFTPHDLRLGPVRSREQGPSAEHISPTWTLAGEPDGRYLSAVVGIQGFSWELLPWNKTRFDGRYLRKLECMIDKTEYDPASGVMTLVPQMSFNNFGGRQGREEVRKWIELLRTLRRSNSKGRVRALARSLRGSYGFDAHYELNVTMLQFAGDVSHPPSRLHNRIQKVAEVSRMYSV